LARQKKGGLHAELQRRSKRAERPKPSSHALATLKEGAATKQLKKRAAHGGVTTQDQRQGGGRGGIGNKQARKTKESHNLPWATPGDEKSKGKAQ